MYWLCVSASQQLFLMSSRYKCGQTQVCQLNVNYMGNISNICMLKWIQDKLRNTILKPVSAPAVAGHTLGVDSHHVPTSSVAFTPTLPSKKAALKCFFDSFLTPFPSCSWSSVADLHAHSHISALAAKRINNGFAFTAKVNHLTYSGVDDRHT